MFLFKYFLAQNEVLSTANTALIRKQKCYIGKEFFMHLSDFIVMNTDQRVFKCIVTTVKKQ